jgi:hypothetical protein
MVTYAASPTPTDARAMNSDVKFHASPESAVAMLQQATPNAIRRGRDIRSPRAPKTGAITANTIKKPDISEPACVSVRASSECFRLSTSAETRYRSR